MSVRPTIIATFQEVARTQDVELAPLSDDLELLDSGLDSLCFAIIVASLEDALGVDPFSEDEEFSFPVTFGDFVDSYESAAASR
jgi:acyl carrier protein